MPLNTVLAEILEEENSSNTNAEKYRNPWEIGPILRKYVEHLIEGKVIPILEDKLI